ncbi:response regulator [Gimesia panareensis]|uniref:response regulator n=1 Tax=Gimesia panareensis TaxID=2527978 RepID=UPI00118D51B5|nr:response regulator [Gimesia panareensis]QDU48448.1 Transcriptional regulatory protein TcrA [Gimesia panareensis]
MLTTKNNQRPLSKLNDYRVLLVEDDPDSQRQITHYLEQAGANVFVVDNGQAAINMALEATQNGFQFEIILMDIEMPGLTGFEAASQLRSEGYKGNIIAFTAYEEKYCREQSLRAGCDEFISKLANRETILEVIRNHSFQQYLKQRMNRVAKTFFNLD